MSRFHLFLTTLLLPLQFTIAGEADDKNPRFIAAIPLNELPTYLYLTEKTEAVADPFAAAANPYNLTDHTTTPDNPPHPSKFLNQGEEFFEFNDAFLTKLFPEGGVDWIVYNASTERLVSSADLETHHQIAEKFHVYRTSDLLKLNARLDSVPTATALRVASAGIAHVPIPPLDPLSEITAFTRVGAEASVANDQGTSSTRRSASLTFNPRDQAYGIPTQCSISFESTVKNELLGELSLKLHSTLLLSHNQPISFILGTDPSRPKQSLALTLTFTSQNHLGDESIAGLTPENPEELTNIHSVKEAGSIRQSMIFGTDIHAGVRKLHTITSHPIVYSLPALTKNPASLEINAPGRRITSAKLTATSTIYGDSPENDHKLEFSQSSETPLFDYSYKGSTTLQFGQIHHAAVTAQHDGTATLLLLSCPLDPSGTRWKTEK